MGDFIAKAVKDATNIAMLGATLNGKVDSIREVSAHKYDAERSQDGKAGKAMPSLIFQGAPYDQMLRAITAPGDGADAQKWLMALALVVKVEHMRIDAGEKVPENAVRFFDGVVSALLDALEAIEAEPPPVAESMWRTVLAAFGLLLRPRVAEVLKCHRRLANRAFKLILQMPSNDVLEQLLLVIITWMCSTRTFSSQKAGDEVVVNQMRVLQSSENDRISKDAAALMLNNVAKLANRDGKTLAEFIDGNVKHVTKELDLGGTNRLKRVLELMVATFERTMSGGAELVIDLVPIWNMLEALVERVNVGDDATLPQTIRILIVLAEWMGPDMVLMNISRFAGIVDKLFGRHDTALITDHAAQVAEFLAKMNQCCRDFYIVGRKHLGAFLDVITAKMEDGEHSHAAKLTNVVEQMAGPAVGHNVEAFILRVTAREAIDWSDEMLADAMVRLVRVHLSRGSSDHPKSLDSMLVLVQRLRGLRRHDNVMDSTIMEIRTRICNAKESDTTVDYALYTQELKRIGPTSASGHEGEPQPESVRRHGSTSSTEPKRTQQIDAVDAIRKKLKSLRQPCNA